MRTLTVAGLPSRFPPVVNPLAPAVHQETVRWDERFRLAPHNAALQQIRATGMGWLAARFHPYASREALQLVSDWTMWMFLDDIMDNECRLK
jgi:hypothetical protein